MEEKIFHFENLVAYQRGLNLVSHVYMMIKKFPKEEQYALSDQLRRAVVSIPSNIAEGMGRFSDKEKVHFLEHNPSGVGCMVYGVGIRVYGVWCMVYGLGCMV